MEFGGTNFDLSMVVFPGQTGYNPQLPNFMKQSADEAVDLGFCHNLQTKPNTFGTTLSITYHVMGSQTWARAAQVGMPLAQLAAHHFIASSTLSRLVSWHRSQSPRRPRPKRFVWMLVIRLDVELVGNAGKDDATKLRILFFMLLIHGFLNFTMIDPFRSWHTHTEGR